MATSSDTVEYILEILEDKDVFSTRKMFGEYALYAHGVVVALICDDQLYVKVLPESKSLEDYCEFAPPYTGAKDHYLVEEHLLHQIDNLSKILIDIASARKTNEKPKRKISAKETVKKQGAKKFMEMTFSERVLILALSIPSGKVSTYGAIARGAGGGAMSSQSITGILAKAHRNGQKNIPFHRIVYSDGRIWTSEEYDKKRRALYKKEGIEIDEKERIKNFKEKLFSF